MAEIKQRLLSLDALRGLTVAGMILVNNSWSPSFTPLAHAQWNGLTPCDLVFPFFLFMVGVSIYLSLSRHAGEPGRVSKIIRRTLVLFVLGVVLHGFDELVWSLSGDQPLSETLVNIGSHIRLWGVLQRIALSYCFAALFFHTMRGRHLWKAIITLMVIYAVILVVGNGYSTVQSENWLWIIDRTLFGDHLYIRTLQGHTPVDPEGLVGVIAGTAHALIGVACGRTLMTGRDTTERLMRLLIIAVSLSLTGWLISFGLPLNKCIWSPSFTLLTCGMAASLLGLFTYFIDLRGYTRWCTPFRWFGMNALFIYTVSEMLPCLIGVCGLSSGIYQMWSGLWGANEWASLCYALTIDAFMALVAWVLYQRKVFIKI